MAKYTVVFIDKEGIGITGLGQEGEIPYGTRKLVFYNTGVEFHDYSNFLDSVNWDDNYKGTAIESIKYNGSLVSDEEEVDYSDGDIHIEVGYEYTPSNPGGGTDPGGGTNPGIDTTPITVTFNYHVNGVLVDDDKFEAIGDGSGLSVDEIWPRTLECYHIRFDKINPTETSNPGTSGSTQYNSLEFTYVSDLRDTSSPNKWPSTSSSNNYKLIQAFSNTYFSKDKCVEINGVGYEPGKVFTETTKPQFHYGGTKTLEVNLYYTAVQVSTTVRTYNRDSSVYNIEEKINNNAYLNRDLWGYTSVGLDNINYSNYTYQKIIYDVPLTSGYEVICYATYKPGFKFVKWVNTSKVEEIHANYAPNSVDRQNEIDKLPALKDETGAENDRDTGPMLHLNAYQSHDVTAIFEEVKNEVKLYKGLDFYGSDTYYIWGGDKQWKNSVNSNVNITIPTRVGAKLLGWVAYTQNDNSLDYPTITRSEYNTLKGPDFNSSHEDIFNYICASREKIKKGVIRIDNFEDVGKPVLLSGVDGYTDSQGNWLTGNTSLYPLWLVEEYPIKYVSAGYDKLYVDETDIDKENGQWYELSPADYKLPLTYTIVDDDFEFPELEKQGDKAFPEYKRFDKWEPSGIKKFSKTGPQTITAYWVLDTYKITLEKNNNYANQSVKIKIGQSTFVGDEKVKSPTTRTAYKSFEGWYTENNIYTNNGCDLTGKLIINKEGILQPNVEGYTDSTGRWIKEGNTTVYAKWTPEEYTITYIIDGEDEHKKYTIEDTKIKIINSGSASFIQVLENGLPLLNNTDLNPPTGKFLDGWYTNANYTGTKKQYLEKGSTGDKTFYGRYKTAEYNIVYYNIEGCTNTEELPAKHVYGNKTDLIKPILPLYKFLDWCTDENFENTITSIPADYTGDSTIKLYAKKIPEIIPISYKDSNGKDLTESSFNSTPPIQYDYENGTQLVKAHKYGYNFDGWYDNPECTGKSFMSLDKEKYTTAVILYCKFIPVEYTIEYYVDGVETTIEGNPSKYTIEDVPIILNNPQDKPGYNSIGWIKNNQDYGVIVKEITTLGDFKLYWSRAPKVITITWDANGGSVSQTSSTYTYNGTSVPMPTPTRTGYTFDGWYTSSTGGNKIADVGVTNKPTTDVTYYALWNNGTGVKYTVQHWKQAVDGTWIKNDDLVEIEIYYGTTGDNISPEVKEYIGFTSPSPAFAQITPEGNTIVTYKYERNKYTISWDANGGEELTGDYTNGSVYFETPIVKPNDPIKSVYTFTGWSPSVPEIMPANDIEFTASYDYEIIEITPVEVNFNLETVNANKIATNKWLHNVLGEPEQTSWGNLSNIFNTDFGSSITGECVTVLDLRNFIITQSPDKCKKQNETAMIFSNSTTSSSLKQNKYYELLKMNSTLGSIEFKVTPVASTTNVPNYPGTDGFIMYFSIGDIPKIYKATIPVNRTCRLQFRAVRANDALIIHRVPCYYVNSTYKIIVPVIYMTNNNSNVHKLYSNTVLLQQVSNM